MLVEYEKGYAIDKNVDTVINSANGFLLLGSGGAGRIRDTSDRLSPNEKLEYQALLNTLPKKIKRWYRHVYHKNGWHRTYAQLSCLKILSRKKNHEFKIGTAVLDTNWSKKDKRKLIHAIAMSYRLTEKGSHRRKATGDTIKEALRRALTIAVLSNSQTIAIPLFCSRPSYGVMPEESLTAILQVIKEFENSLLNKITICVASNSTIERLKNMHFI